jgi:hypothetical protein
MPAESAQASGLADGGLDLLRPDWQVPEGIVGAMSSRLGGVSAAPFDSLNLRPPGLPGQPADAPEAVHRNQGRFAEALGASPVWLEQVHGADVVRLTEADVGRDGEVRPLFHRADASVTTAHGVACTVLVADCLPVLFCSDDGRAVGAAHAGWRGLAAGVLEHTLAALCEAAGCGPSQVQGWMGACIGAGEFEVGADVLRAFDADPAGKPGEFFVYRPRADGSPRWLADLPGLARQRLRSAGMRRITGGRWCTVADRSRFFSYRRDGLTGRMAAAVAIRDR